MKKIISGIIFVLLLVCFIFLGTRDYKKAEPKDNEVFSAEYQEIDENNIYVYKNASDVLRMLRGGNGIIFMGFKSNIWAGYYANILNGTAMELGLTEIYYYDFYEDRKNSNGTYQSIVEVLNDYVTVLDDGTKDLHSPSIVIVKDGAIIGFNNDTAFTNGNMNPEEYWTEYQVSLEKIKLGNMIKEYLGNTEEDINEG